LTKSRISANVALTALTGYGKTLAMSELSYQVRRTSVGAWGERNRLISNWRRNFGRASLRQLTKNKIEKKAVIGQRCRFGRSFGSVRTKLESTPWYFYGHLAMFLRAQLFTSAS